MHSVVERSLYLFDSGLYCAESVLQAVTEHEGVESDLIPRIATGFCGGIARTSGPCGVVTGGIMAIGIIRGRDHFRASPYVSYGVVNAFMEKFAGEFGAVNCTELLGCDLGNPEGYSLFEKENLIETVCRRLIIRGTAILMEILEKARPLAGSGDGLL